MRGRASRAAGLVAALAWGLLALRWFDAGTAFRPAWLAALPPLALALPLGLALAVAWLARARARPGVAAGGAVDPERAALWLTVALALGLRLPLAWHGAAGFTTADGALSGIVSLRLLEGAEHFVFVPRVPYSGSLKSHLAALVALLGPEPARAFTLASVLFYALFVAGLFRLAQLVRDGPAGAPRALPLAAGLYAAFAPPFVTRYSLSNDGNYVEVLALGTWALVLAGRWQRDGARRAGPLLVAGLLLGLGFWCHLLAVIPATAVGVFALARAGRGRAAALLALGAGWGLGYVPGLLWNASHSWESFRYLLPGGTPVGEGAAALPLVARAVGLVADQLPVLLGYDHGYPLALDVALRAGAFVALVVLAAASGRALREALRERDAVLGLVLLFAGVNLAAAFFALPQLAGNPRYLLFLTAPAALLLARGLVASRPGAVVFAGIVALGALASLGQAPAALRADARWRGLVARLEAEAVGHCYTDFYLATKINFLSRERVVCSAELGPTTTEYFLEYRAALEAAPSAAYVAVNGTHADKLERRLGRLGVTAERLELMKPVLLRLTRKVDPQELFPGRPSPPR